jgi:DNA-binding SARP family transcriptional activator
LLDRLNDATSSRLTLVIAEAGYGKTTLLADFSSRATARCLWYKLDSTDADPITWTNYVIAAAQEIDPDFGQNTLSLLAQVGPGGPPESAFIASLLGELPRLGEAPTVLVLDDFHLVDDSEEARDFVTRLILESPAWLRFVISSRRMPTLQLARLAGMGEVAQITTDELRFTNSETDRLFADGYGVALDPDVLSEIGIRTHGWVASLQLFHGSIRGRPSSAIRALARSLSGSSGPIYDFLAQEVLKNVAVEIEEFLIRGALLDRIVPQHAVALFAERHGLGPGEDQARQWIDECDRLGLLSRSSQSSEARQLHPLLRDFLLRQLSQRHSAEAIRAMHLAVADAVAESDPLLACRHYIEAGRQEEAMACLGRSVMLTMGSGQWGIASSLVERLDGVRADPAVLAIRARRLIEDGDLAGAEELLAGVELAESSPDVRAVFRHTKLSLDWRTGDRDSMFAILREIQGDAETPAVLRDIADIFMDASPYAEMPISLPNLVQRLLEMAKAQLRGGHSFYAAISLHNAAIAESVAGHPSEAIRIGEAALEQYDRLSFPASERYSTHALMAACWLELGDIARADEHVQLGLSSGGEHGDVHAEFAYLFALIGRRQQAGEMLMRAELQRRRGLSDLQADGTSVIATAFLNLAQNPHASYELMAEIPRERPLDVGDSLAYDALLGLAYLRMGESRRAADVAVPALEKARTQLARRPEVRLAIVAALATENVEDLRAAVSDATVVGDLALLEVADAVGDAIHMFPSVPPELEKSIEKWPGRWLPVLRRQLEGGNLPSARVAALLLDEHGRFEDVGRLRAFAKTYSRRGRVSGQLGRQLAKRVGPKLEILDLGRARLRVGARTIDVSSMRRKPASLLMYLVTRPTFTATREQVLEELWPDNDPSGAANSLNQSLYFLRRDIDPWYEDDLSIEYLPFEGDLVWLEPDLVRVASADFLVSVRDAGRTLDITQILQVLDGYTGSFSPEFEYEEWAIAWRTRTQVAFFEFSQSAVASLLSQMMFEDARDVALRALEVEPDARDVERKLVATYWQLGSRAAAAAQYAHYAAEERADGVDPPSLEALVNEEIPKHE